MELLRSSNGHAAVPSEVPHVVIIGGGIAGLSAAYELGRMARAAGVPLRSTLVERDTRLGGKIQTDTPADLPGFVIEGGPDSFVAQKPWAVELAHELGLGDQLIGANEVRHSTSVLIGGQPRPFPEGMSLIVPTRLLPFVTSPLLSPLGKLRMALDLVIPARRDDGDETLADFIRRRLGQEALDRIAEPLLAGIHSAEPERQSIMATFPRFRGLERQHGSLIRGMRAQRRPAGAAPGGISSSPFVTLRGGVGALVSALVARIDSDLCIGRAVVGITPRGDQGGYRVRLDDGAVLEADRLILATPSFVAAELLAPFQPELAAELRRIRYVSTAIVSFAFPETAIGRPLDGFGVVIPRSEGRRINACTITSCKFANRAPAGTLLARVFLGGSQHPEVMELDDDALIALARDELGAILKIDGPPLFARLHRWPSANPQYNVGHLDLVAAIEARCPADLALIGCAYRGVGIPDCVRQGREAAAQVVTRLNQQLR